MQGMSGDFCLCKPFSRTCLACKGFRETNKHRSTGQQPGTKSTSRPAGKPRINCLSTADFLPAFGLHRISLVRASGETFRRRVFNALGSTKDGCLLGELFCSTPPRRPAVRPDPTRPLYVRVLDSANPCKAYPGIVILISEPVESKTRTYHGRVGSGRPAERPGGVGQDWVPTELFAQEAKVPCTLQGIEETSLQRLSRSTNKRNPM